MTMTKLLEQAITQIEKLPPTMQDVIAERLLEELDERHWDAQFAATTDEQWARMAARVREQIAAGNAIPLDENLRCLARL